MKVVFIGCDKFKGTDTCGFQYSFYKDNFKPGDIFDIVTGFVAPNSNITIYFNWSSPNYHNGVFRSTISLPKKYFVTLEEWREIRLNKIGISDN